MQHRPMTAIDEQGHSGENRMCDLCGDAEHTEQSAHSARREFLKIGAIGAAAALAPWHIRSAMAADAPSPQNAITPADALKRLMDGNARYVGNASEQRDFSAERAARAQSQHPIAAILSCADSRVAPELVLDQGLGDLFVVRVAGNIVSRDLLASLEFGVQFLGAPLIMVLGHSGCGAVDAAITVLKTKAVLPGHLPELIAEIKPAVLASQKASSGDPLDNAIAENVRQQVAKLKNSAPIIQKSYAGKKIEIVGGVYDLRTGKVTLL
jgi:carbonic anhydrase